MELLDILKNKYTPEVLAFYKGIFKDGAYKRKLKSFKISAYYDSAEEKASRHFIQGPSQVILPIWEELVNKKTAADYPDILTSYFKMALEAYPKERHYDVFAPYYDGGMLHSSIMFSSDSHWSKLDESSVHLAMADEAFRERLDPRWGQHFAKKSDPLGLRIMLAEDSPYAGLMRVALLKRLKEFKEKDTMFFYYEIGQTVNRFAEAMEKEQGTGFKDRLPELKEACYTLLKKLTGPKRVYFYKGIGDKSLTVLFSSDYQEKLGELL